MLASELIYTIKSLKNGGQSTDESEISDHQYLFIINYIRAMLIRQQQREGQSVSPFITQTIKVECKESGCDVISKTKLPKPIELHNWEMIIQVGDGLERTKGQVNTWMKYAKYTSKHSRWTIKDGYLVIDNYYGQNLVPVVGVWEDPYEIELLNGNINELDPYSFNYPMSAAMVRQMNDLIIAGEVRFATILGKDMINNSNEDSQQQRND